MMQTVCTLIADQIDGVQFFRILGNIVHVCFNIKYHSDNTYNYSGKSTIFYTEKN